MRKVSYLDALYDVENKEVEKLKKEIRKIQRKCKHKYGKEWQEYNIYKQRCKKCGFIHSEEY